MSDYKGLDPGAAAGGRNLGKRLLIRPGAVGDCVVSLPALESLRADFTEVWVTGTNVPLIRFADRVRAISATGLDLLEISAPAGLVESLRGFDSIMSWYGGNRRQFRDTVRALGLPFRFFPALPENEELHAVDFYLAQAVNAGGRMVEATPRIACSGPRGDYVVIHPFSGSRRKNWPLEQFREVASAISDQATVIWCAGPEEELPEARRFDDLGSLARWLGRARLYIGNDSGISHLAAAVGIPVVAIFGPTDERIWAPRGKCVRVVRAAGLREPIDAVSVADVLPVVRELLADYS